MPSINQIKEGSQTDTPLLLFRCVLPSGDVERWSTHQIQFGVEYYSARVVEHNLFDLQLSSDDAMDGISKLTLSLANADSRLSEINAAIRMKGAQLTVYFAFADLQIGLVTTDSTVLFRGISGDPEEVTENLFVLSFINKLSLQRVPVPDVRIQRSCVWNFPVTQDQRTEARDGNANGLASRYYRCGYSADLPNGVGNLVNGEPYVSCDKSRKNCEARGMFNIDSSGNATARYGGFEFVPSAISVRTAGDKASHLSPLLTNAARYNDSVPLVYGTGWLRAPVIFARNDGELTHMEVLIGLGPITGLVKVIVNDIEIPLAVPSQDKSVTGWYSVVSLGNRIGAFNPDFVDDQQKPLGDPHGSMATMSVVVPNRISNGVSLPTIEVLVQGLQVFTYDEGGANKSLEYSNNPAWVILDILGRCGWSSSDLNLDSFVRSAEYCQYLITTSDLNGNQIQVPRFECNLILTKRQSAASIVRGVRVASSLMLRYGASGLLELLPETTLAAQHPSIPDGSNSFQELDGGFPAYEFSDASGSYSGIIRRSDGSSSVRLSSRSIAECSNRLSVEFQDATNEYQQDSLSLVDVDDSALIGYEISSQSTALGISNFSQATRVLLRQLDKLTKGNLFLELQTSFKALKVRPGDLIAVTYLKEGFLRTPFRISKLSPSTNYETVTLQAQLHSDDWYSDDPAVLGGRGRQPGSGSTIPKPLIGIKERLNADGSFSTFDFGLSEDVQVLKDGTAIDRITVSFSQPTKPSATGGSIPLVGLAPRIDTGGGGLAGGTTYYYAVSSKNSQGQEDPLSFTIAATVPDVGNKTRVSIVDLSFPTTATTFNVYRGLTPQTLFCIAKEVPLAGTFTDSGMDPLPMGPPDANFDHANFYYRYEYLGPLAASSAGRSSITCEDMGATETAYVGFVVRIIDGAGRGQERSVVANTTTSLTLSLPWSTLPDTSSSFVICESSWHFAAVSLTSPVTFDVPYRQGAVLQISGRGANVHNQEGSPDLCPITRLALGQDKPDFGIPATPFFSLDTPGGGIVKLSQIGFSDIANVASISGGTLRLYYWDEVASPSTILLIGLDSRNMISLDPAPSLSYGDVLQIGRELILVTTKVSDAGSWNVVRGVLGSPSEDHANGSRVQMLRIATSTVSFSAGFFENRASVNLIHSLALPDVRISAAEFFATNAFGDGQVATECFTSGSDSGLRTLSGGQMTLQVSGYLASQINATNSILVERSHAVRDLRATLSAAAIAYRTVINVFQNAELYCSLSIDAGQMTSEPGGGSTEVFSGAGLPALKEGAVITADVSLSVTDPLVKMALPARDLTVTIRF